MVVDVDAATKDFDATAMLAIDRLTDWHGTHFGRSSLRRHSAFTGHQDTPYWNRMKRLRRCCTSRQRNGCFTLLLLFAVCWSRIICCYSISLVMPEDCDWCQASGLLQYSVSFDFSRHSSLYQHLHHLHHKYKYLKIRREHLAWYILQDSGCNGWHIFPCKSHPHRSISYSLTLFLVRNCGWINSYFA